MQDKKDREYEAILEGFEDSDLAQKKANKEKELAKKEKAKKKALSKIENKVTTDDELDKKENEELENLDDDKKSKPKFKLNLKMPSFDLKAAIKTKEFWSGVTALVVIITIIGVAAAINQSKEHPKDDYIAEETTLSIEDAPILISPENEEFVSNMANPPQTDMQKAALNSAIEYYNHAYISKDAIYNQLIGAGQTPEDAQYAVDNCGADWNEVAINAAKKYVNTGIEGISRAALVDKLKGDGFTEEQASYAADNSEVDYVEQAKKEALFYLSVEKYEKQDLIDLLVMVCEFTEKEAKAGVNLAFE